MAITLNQNTDCCETTCTSTTVNVAGPAGAAGAAGSNGTVGSNAHTTLNADFTMPAVSITVAATVLDSGWMSVGQAVYVSGGGYFEVTAKASATAITLKNLYATPTNSAVGATVNSSNTVSASGIKGDTGAAGAAGAGAVTLVKGGLSTFSTSNTALAVGANGKFLGADSTAVTGLAWDTVKYSDLQASTLALNTVTTSGQLPLAGIANAGGAAGDIAYWNGSAWVKLAKGTTGHLLEQGSSNAPQWAAPTTNDFNIEAMGRIAYADGSPDSVSFDGTPTNCAGSPSLSGSDVTINFTTTISNSHPKVMLTPVGLAALNLYVTSISTSSLVVHAGTANAHSFHFVVFA
jgi:hypothetical protein